MEPGELTGVWSALCQPQEGPPAPEFLAVYPHLTTFQGTRFCFRGGEPEQVCGALETLLDKRSNSGQHVRLRVED
jgi:hypothetical protein